MTEKEELQQMAQEKLVEARSLLKEAGEMAERGNFTLSFDYGGTYIPKNYTQESFREEAIENLQKEGKYVGKGKSGANADGYLPWANLSEGERESAVDNYCRDVYNDSLPYMYTEDASGEGLGDWWQPSTC